MTRHCPDCPAWVEATYRYGELVALDLYHPHGTGARCAGTRTPIPPAEYVPMDYRAGNYDNGRLSDPNRPSRAAGSPYNRDPDSRLRLSRQFSGWRNTSGRTASGTRRHT